MRCELRLRNEKGRGSSNLGKHEIVRDRPFSVGCMYERKKIFERDHGMCRLCGNGSHLVVHHLNYRHQPLYELLTLCERCHAMVHSWHKEKLKWFNRDWMAFLKSGEE